MTKIVPDESADNMALQHENFMLRQIVDTSSDAICIKDLQGNYIYCNSAAARYMGRSIADIVGRDDLSLWGTPFGQAMRDLDQAVLRTETTQVEEHRIQIEGAFRSFIITKYPYRAEVGNVVGVIVVARDVTKKRAAEQALQAQHQFLERLVRGCQLRDLLHDLVAMIEREFPGVIASFLLADRACQHLYVAAGPTLPATYNQAIDGVGIGPRGGSCGTAAYRAEPVYVADIANDPLWKDFRDLALAHGLKACWSTPILSRAEESPRVLGTFAVYSHKVGLPDPKLMEFLARIEYLAHIAIESRQAIEDIQASESRFRTFVENTTGAFFLHDPVGRVVDVNTQACNHLRMTRDEIIGLMPFDFDPCVTSAGLNSVLESLDRGAQLEFETQHRRSDGSVFPVEVRLSPFYMGDHRYAIAVAHDITERKRNAEAVMEGQRQFRLALHAASAIAFVWDIPGDSVIRYYSTESTLTAIPVAPESLAQVRKKIHPEDRLLFDRGIQRCLKEGTEYRNLYRVLRDDGTYGWLEEWGYLERSDDGSPLRLTGVSIDVTDRKQAEAELRRTADLLRAVADGTTDAVFVKDLEGRYLLFNEAAARFVGKPVEEVLGRDDSALFESESALRIKAHDQKVMMGGEVVTAEEKLTAAGATRTYLATKGPYRDEYGHVIGIIGISRDISDRKADEAALQKSEREFADLFDNAAVGIQLVAADGTIMRANHALLEMLGYPLDEYVGKSIEQFHESPEATQDILRLLASHETLVGYPSRLRCKDGSYREVVIDTSVRWQGNEFVSTRCFIRDVTEKKTLEEQVRQSQKMEAVGRLAGGVAHDFNNLLTVINGYAELLLTGPAVGESQRDALMAIRDAGQRAASLTAQLLAFSRKAIVEPQDLDLNQVVESSVKMLRRLVGEDIHLRVYASPVISSVRADRGQVEQVIMNLVVNARDAMPLGGDLSIETKLATIGDGNDFIAGLSPGTYVMLQVSDTGEGMTEEVRSKVFEPFFTTKGIGKGTGLGLAVVHGIMQQCGGHATVESRVGHGTSFTLYFPTKNAHEGELGMARASHDRAYRKTLLLVEEDHAVRAMAKTALETLGYHVLEADDVASALHWASEWQGTIHLLITNWHLAGSSGRFLADGICADRAETRVLFLSGRMEDAVHLCHATEAFLAKPFSLVQLKQKVQLLLSLALDDSRNHLT